ncbi:MAG TPA: glutamate--tRNA ligase [Candidatus Acidoferrum sp.]|nr:glutamate--tRNA ligase [Candidatus Acidoferrum sp.]
MEKKLTEMVRKYAIKNAIDYGKADPGSVLGKIIPQAKGIPVPEIRAEVERVVKEVNKLGNAQLEKEYAPYSDEFEEKAADTVKKTEKPKMELEGAKEGKFATRFPPEPSGYLHVGHAKPVFLEQEFAKIYRGKLFLYFDDTNPEKEKQEFVDSDKRDLEWLGVKFDSEYYASDHLDEIYVHAKKLIKDGNAYVCLCDQETMKKERLEMQECRHRAQTPKQNASEFEKMLSGGYKDGEAALRFMGDMKADNTALRDPIIARIKSERHYRQGSKYRAWPTYDLAAPIMDSIRGVTHVMRSKEYELRDELDTKILNALKLRAPKIVPFSRLNINGYTTHKREIRKLLTDGIIKEWDDPRLMTLIALKRRGIMPEAIRNFTLKMGMTKTDSAVPFDMLLAENRKIINGFAWHLFFVDDPVKLVVKGAKNRKVSMKLLPSGEFGNREYTSDGNFLISGSDARSLKNGDGVRLKDFIDIKITAKGASEITAEEARAGSNDKIIQWVPAGNNAKCKILVPGPLLGKDGSVNPDSLKTIEGYAEGYVERLSDHEIVQFERFGYCILDDKKKMQFIFISK